MFALNHFGTLVGIFCSILTCDSLINSPESVNSGDVKSVFTDLCSLTTEEFVLTLNVQEHALLMASDPAEGFAVKSTQVAETHAADGQHRLAVTTADFEPPVLALKIKQTNIQLIFRHTHTQ